MQNNPAAAATRMLVTLCLGWCAASAVAGAEPDRSATLQAIHDLENPRDVSRPGRFGELGAYQFREATWRKYTTEPFERALDRQRSDEIAVQHYEWLKRQLEAAHVVVTPYRIALAWNAGIRAALTGRCPAATRDYAQRAANLAAAYAEQEVVAAR